MCRLAKPASGPAAPKVLIQAPLNSVYKMPDAIKVVRPDADHATILCDRPDLIVGYHAIVVSVLAYARVDGESLLAGHEVTGWNGAAPFADGLPQKEQ